MSRIFRAMIMLVLWLLALVGGLVFVQALHDHSGLRIWSLFQDSYHVREMGIYLVNVMPFFALTSVGLAVLRGKLFSGHQLSWVMFYVFGGIALALAVLLHIAFFPTSVRGLIFAATFVVGALGAYVLMETLSRWLLGAAALTARGSLLPVLIVTILVGVGYVGVLNAIAETPSEVYDLKLERTPDDYVANSPVAGAFAARFEAVDLGVKLNQTTYHPYDFDRDGRPDILSRDADDRLAVWLNRGDRLEPAEGILPPDSLGPTGKAVLGDYNGDGQIDLLFMDYGGRKEPTIINNFIKKFFFYPWLDKVGHGRLFKGQADGDWAEVTDQAFPDGAPVQYRKVEPIMWFDANGDGLLDVLWQGYPHPLRTFNHLYIQTPEGTFENRIADLLDNISVGTYPEGSDLGDFDGDGDIDFLGYGYPYRNDGGRYTQLCDATFPGLLCDMPGRNEEGWMIEDVDADGALDIVMSHHGVGVHIPKYYLQLYRGDLEKPGRFIRDKDVETRFYGFNTYMRAKDSDGDGFPEILTERPGRLITMINGDWLDLMPAVTGAKSGAYEAGGWLDWDDDGDWDFIVHRKSDGHAILFKNQGVPRRQVRLAAKGATGQENQMGATVYVTVGDRTRVEVYRLMAGYRGFADPRITVPLGDAIDFTAKVCFPSLTTRPSGEITDEGVTVTVDAVEGACVSYAFRVDALVTSADIQLLAGDTIAKIDSN